MRENVENWRNKLIAKSSIIIYRVNFRIDFIYSWNIFQVIEKRISCGYLNEYHLSPSQISWKFQALHQFQRSGCHRKLKSCETLSNQTERFKILTVSAVLDTIHLLIEARERGTSIARNVLIFPVQKGGRGLMRQTGRKILIDCLRDEEQSSWQKSVRKAGKCRPGVIKRISIRVSFETK